MRGLIATVCASALLASCDSRSSAPVSPLGPSPAPLNVPANGRLFTHTVSGVVRAAGMVVPSAQVAVVEQSPVSEAQSDDTGRYSVSAASSIEGMSPLLSARYEGYFTDTRFANANYTPLANDASLDFALEPLHYVPLGSVVKAPGTPGICSHYGYGTGTCQRFAIRVASNGTLVITGTGFRTDVDVVGPDGQFAAYDPCQCGQILLLIPARAGSTYEFRVGGGSTTFEFTTELR